MLPGAEPLQVSDCASFYQERLWRVTDRVASMKGLSFLSYAIVVAEKKSISSAARALNVQQSVVSRHIRNLEDSIGVSIFERVPGGIKLTKAGKCFLERSENILTEFDRAMKAAALAGCGDEGEISIGVEAPLSEAYLHDLLQTYRGLYKHVSIQIIQESKTQLLRRMLRSEIDFALVHAKPFGSDFDIGGDDFDSEIFWQTKLFVALPQAHPFVEESVIDLEMLKSEQILLGAYGCEATINDYRLALKAGISHHPKIERHNVSRDAVMNLVGLGFGVTFTSEAGASRHYADVSIKPIRGVLDRLAYQGVWRPQNDNPAFRCFLSLARSKSKERKRA